MNDFTIPIELVDGESLEFVELIPVKKECTSNVWDHFNHFKTSVKSTRDNKIYERSLQYCNHPGCSTTFGENTSSGNLINHLKNEHYVQCSTKIVSKRPIANSYEQDQFRTLITLFVTSSGNCYM